jgi:hypothetical protein
LLSVCDVIGSWLAEPKLRQISSAFAFRLARLACRAEAHGRFRPPSPFGLRRGSLRIASRAKAGGAGRDRTDDLKLAKLPLSQLSYGPILGRATGAPGWLAEPKLRLVSPAFALRASAGLPSRSSRKVSPAFALRATARQPSHRFASEGWWARVDSNYRPHAYQACALTT